jgi:hypothetical protein
LKTAAVEQRSELVLLESIGSVNSLLEAKNYTKVTRTACRPLRPWVTANPTVRTSSTRGCPNLR